MSLETVPAQSFPLLIDEAATTIASPYVPGSGSMVVANGAVFGSLTGSQTIRLTVLTAAGAFANYLCTAISGNTLTVAVTDGYADIALPVGSAVAITANKGTFDDIFASIQVIVGVVNYNAVNGGGGGTPGGTSGQVQYNNGGAFGGFTVSGDGTLNSATGALAVTKSGGTAFGSAAFQPSSAFDASGAASAALASAEAFSGNAGNLSSGTVPSARLSGVYSGITGVGTLASATNPVLSISQPTSGVNGISISDGTNTGKLGLNSGQLVVTGGSGLNLIGSQAGGGSNVVIEDGYGLSIHSLGFLNNSSGVQTAQTFVAGIAETGTAGYTGFDFNVSEGTTGTGSKAHTTWQQNGSTIGSLDTKGNLLVGPGSLSTLATDGFLYVGSCLGAPTGTPTTKSGYVPIVADATDKYVYAYMGGAWVGLNKPAGSSGQVQYNSSGAMAASSNLAYSGSTLVVTSSTYGIQTVNTGSTTGGILIGGQDTYGTGGSTTQGVVLNVSLNSPSGASSTTYNRQLLIYASDQTGTEPAFRIGFVGSGTPYCFMDCVTQNGSTVENLYLTATTSGLGIGLGGGTTVMPSATKVFILNEASKVGLKIQSAANPSVDQLEILNSGSSVLYAHDKLGRPYTGNTTPTIAAGTGAGTSPTVSISGTDVNGVVTITTGTSPAASATVATITFSSAYAAAPKTVMLTPAEGNAAALYGVAAVYAPSASISTTAWVLSVGSTALAASTAYKFFYQVLG